MKRVLIVAIFLTAVLASASALDAVIVYLEGNVDLKPVAGGLEWADFGTELREGDTIVTGINGYCEIELPNGSTVKISPDTVFIYQQNIVNPGGEPQNVFQVAVGQVSFRFNQLGSQEPSIRTQSGTAGVRGTEFTVIAGEDGQSLFVVAEGAVEVEAAGQAVQLGANEGVEVSLLRGLGESFPAISGSIDYSSWRQDAQDRAIEDPAALVREFIPMMQEYMELAAIAREENYRLRDQTDEMLEHLNELKEKGLTEEADAYVAGPMTDLRLQVTMLGFNSRYYLLSAQSIRRYVLANLYVQERTSSWNGEMDSAFADAYAEFEAIYNEYASELFVRADI